MPSFRRRQALIKAKDLVAQGKDPLSIREEVGHNISMAHILDLIPEEEEKEIPASGIPGVGL